VSPPFFSNPSFLSWFFFYRYAVFPAKAGRFAAFSFAQSGIALESFEKFVGTDCKSALSLWRYPSGRCTDYKSALSESISAIIGIAMQTVKYSRGWSGSARRDYNGTHDNSLMKHSWCASKKNPTRKSDYVCG
jgi:hypothetical protein